MKKTHETAIPLDLLKAQKDIYEPLNLTCKNLSQEAESKEYGAYTFELNDRRVKFRVAKITPTKIGQFVTLWKRIGMGPILPYDMADSIDLFIISVRNTQHFGQFVFPKFVLYEKGILSNKGLGGKRAMRVYPSWDIPNNPQAIKTQAWQLKYFFEMPPHDNSDMQKIRKLFDVVTRQ